MRRTVLMVFGTALLTGLLTGQANAASAPGSCSAGFEGPVGYDELLKTPEVEAALAADPPVYDEIHVADVLAIVDNNGDGQVCWKSVGRDNRHFMVFYAGRYVDNNSAPK